jgi:hypothetical protein
MQRTMFDPREAPTATAEMLADRDLRGAIAAMRRRNRVKVVGYWPYVEAIEGGVKAWAVDDRGVRFVVVGSMVFEMADFEILNRKVQKSASDVFVRLDAGVAAMSKRDDTRILVALREQYVVAFHWHGTERPRFSHDIIEHPDGRRRYVAHTACRRLYGAGLIVNDGWTPPCDYGDWSEPYRLTAAGQAAAAHLPAIPDEVMFAPPKVTPPQKLEDARHKLKARKIAAALTFNKARIREGHVKFTTGGNSLIDAFASTYRGEIPEAVMALLMPHLESFVDIDGKESLRITEAGTARKRLA